MSLKSLPLNNGYSIPALGLGTYRGDGFQDIIKTALEVGYRLIDTAFVYQNEPIIGKALQSVFAENKIKREDLFVVSKLWNTDHRPERVPAAIKRSLRDLQLDYLDLYLMHWPFAVEPNPDNEFEIFNNPEDPGVTLEETWRAMEELVKQGYTRSIGVSNFNSQQIKRILEIATIKPVVNQVECNPYLLQEKLRALCKENNIQVMAYSPFYAPGRIGSESHGLDLFTEPIIEELARKYKKSTSQIILRYLVQCGVIPIPKTDKLERLKSNFDIQDFTLSAEDVEKMRSLNQDRRCTAFAETKNFKEYPFKIEF